MRILSDNIPTTDKLTAVDTKQSEEIFVLKCMLLASFVVNAALSIGLFCFY